MSLAEIETLIARTAKGDKTAFGALYDATSGKLFGVILRVLKDRAAAEDALQDVYLKIWNYAGRYSADGHNPMTWLITIARNTAIDHLRANRSTDDLADFENLIPDTGPTPESAAVAASDAKRIATCMQELGADRRNAVIGAYLHGKSYADLSHQYGVPLNTMRTWLRRSLIVLRECMEP